MLNEIFSNFHAKDKKKSEKLTIDNMQTKNLIYDKNDKLVSVSKQKKNIINNKNILNFSYKDISLEKKKQTHIDSLDLERFNKEFSIKKKFDKRAYLKSLKTLNRKEILLKEKKIFSERQVNLLEDSYAKLIASFPLKKTMSAYFKYKRDLKKHPYKKYLKIKTMQDLVKAKLLQLEKQNLKKKSFRVTKKMIVAYSMTKGLNFLPKDKVIKKKKVNVLDAINKVSNKTFDLMYTYLDKTFINFLLIHKFNNVSKFPLE
jgi:hypothetical protein